MPKTKTTSEKKTASRTGKSKILKPFMNPWTSTLHEFRFPSKAQHSYLLKFLATTALDGTYSIKTFSLFLGFVSSCRTEAEILFWKKFAFTYSFDNIYKMTLNFSYSTNSFYYTFRPK